MIALNEERFQIVKKGDEMPETNRWKRRFIFGFTYHICFCIVLAVLAFSWFDKTEQDEKQLVPIWVEPKYERSVNEYYEILKGVTDGM